MMDVEKILSRLETYDGVATSILTETQKLCNDGPDFLEKIISLIAYPSEKISEGATWILKAEIENGAALPPDYVDLICDKLDHIQSWQAILHILQLSDKLTLTSNQAQMISCWAEKFLDHQRPFLRAWSLNALIKAMMASTANAEIIESILSRAEEDEAASVRARARKLRLFVEKTQKTNI